MYISIFQGPHGLNTVVRSPSHYPYMHHEHAPEGDDRGGLHNITICANRVRTYLNGVSAVESPPTPHMRHQPEGRMHACLEWPEPPCIQYWY